MRRRKPKYIGNNRNMNTLMRLALFFMWQECEIFNFTPTKKQPHKLCSAKNWNEYQIKLKFGAV